MYCPLGIGIDRINVNGSIGIIASLLIFNTTLILVSSGPYKKEPLAAVLQ